MTIALRQSANMMMMIADITMLTTEGVPPWFSSMVKDKRNDSEKKRAAYE
ncbi:MAG TPA: hypothetical protein VL593_10815 [Ramlibacter sp.]|nr:hypothetical protein [Ramlibacter sp.]